MKKQFIATLAIALFSAQAFAVVMPGAPARNAYVFKKDFENAQKNNAAARLAAKDKKTSTAIAKGANDGVIDLALLDDETNRDDKYRLSAAGTNIAANTPNAGTGDPTVIGTENPPGGGGGPTPEGPGNEGPGGENPPPGGGDDGNNGHGNDPDGDDDSNPGNGNPPVDNNPPEDNTPPVDNNPPEDNTPPVDNNPPEDTKPPKEDKDKDNGHGNDEDRDDDSNPGQGGGVGPS